MHFSILILSQLHIHSVQGQSYDVISAEWLMLQDEVITGEFNISKVVL